MAIEFESNLPHGNILDAVRDSCIATRGNSCNHVEIVPDALIRFIDTTTDWSFQRSAGLPLRFDTLEQELNIFCLQALLNFGSGWRELLHKHCGRGASETITFGVLTMHISPATQTSGLGTKFMKEVTVTDISEMFNIPMTETFQPQPGIEMTRPGPLAPLIKMLTDVMNETGGILESHGYLSLAKFVLDITSKKVENGPLASGLVSNLVKVFPAFRDQAKLAQQDVYFFKKAQSLAVSLYHLFGSRDPERFKFSDYSKLTCLADNVVPCVLRELGVLKYSDELANKVDTGDIQWKNMHEKELEASIRAASVVAVDMISDELKKRGRDIAPVDVDFFLWQLGKQERFRSKRRHASPQTIFY